MDPIRFGTIGSGWIVTQFLGQFSRVDGVRLEAVYSRTREKGESLAGQYGAPKVYTDMEAFLSDPLVDAIYIATPNLLHYGQAREALLHGKHVVCEKPFCLTREHARELFAIAAERGVMLLEAIPTPYLPNFGVLREAVGRIGRVRLVMGNYSQYSSRYDLLKAGTLTNIFDPAFAGGCLMDINYYNLHLTAALFGDPQGISCDLNRWPGAADTSGTVIMRYPDFHAVCIGAKDAAGVNFYQVEGDGGYVHVAGGSNGLRSVSVTCGGQTETIDLQEDPDRYFYFVEHLSRILHDRPAGTLDAFAGYTIRAVGAAEQARRAGGLVFPAEENAFKAHG